MSKKFTYKKLTKCHYCSYSDEWEEDGIEFEYEVEDDDLLYILTEYVYYDYFDSCCERLKENIEQFIKENDLIGTLADCYEDKLKEYFKSEAMYYYKEHCQ